jgi:UDP-glucuronate 4-epimerase
LVHLSVLETVRHLKTPPLLVYASYSSVYRKSAKPPFSEKDRVDDPVSLYAATKRSCELMSQAYSHLYGMRQVGLRFFTVYGPWGRPDMAYWSFTKDILEGRPLRLFNNGQLRRDFTWVGDIVAGVLACALGKPKAADPQQHRIYNLGNNRPVELGRFVEILEDAIGRKAQKILEPMQPGDVLSTCADISAMARDYGYAPTTDLETGIPQFVAWYRDYFKV